MRATPWASVLIHCDCTCRRDRSRALPRTATRSLTHVRADSSCQSDICTKGGVTARGSLVYGNADETPSRSLIRSAVQLRRSRWKVERAVLSFRLAG